MALAVDGDMTKQDILALDIVVAHNDWTSGRHNRTYLTLKGQSSRYRGDKTTKIYWDNNSDRLVIESGKGMTSNDFDASLAALEEVL